MKGRAAVTARLDDVTNVERKEGGEELPYDWLHLAVGSGSSESGNQEVFKVPHLADILIRFNFSHNCRLTQRFYEYISPLQC